GHQLIHLHYLLAGCLYAWVVAGPDPAPRRPGLAGRVALLVAASAAHACLAKLLYAGADRLPPGLADRDPAAWQAAAELMYYGGTGADLLLATALFAAWYRRRGPAYRRVAAVRAPGPCRSVDAGVSRVDGASSHSGVAPDAGARGHATAHTPGGQPVKLTGSAKEWRLVDCGAAML